MQSESCRATYISRDKKRDGHTIAGPVKPSSDQAVAPASVVLAGKWGKIKPSPDLCNARLSQPQVPCRKGKKKQRNNARSKKDRRDKERRELKIESRNMSKVRSWRRKSSSSDSCYTSVFFSPCFFFFQPLSPTTFFLFFCFNHLCLRLFCLSLFLLDFLS